MKNKFSRIKTSAWQKIVLVFLGLILSLVFLEAGLRLGGFVLLSIQDYGNLRSVKQKGAYRILCLGESTTQGQYPHFLEEVLNQRHIGVRFSVIDKGRAGTTTSAILNRVESYLAEYHPDMVVAMMGINERGEHIPFEAATASKGALFIRSLRIYKLARFLRLHIVTKAKEMGGDKPDRERRGSGKVRTHLWGTKPNETSAQPFLMADSFTKAIELNPEDDHTCVELGRFYREQGKFSQAEDSFKKTIEIDPQNDAAYVELGMLYRDQDKFSLAEDLFKKAIKVDPQNGAAFVGLGRLCRARGEFLEPEDLFKKALELNPKNDAAYFELGRLYQEQGELSQAGNFYKKAVEINPKNDDAYVGFGRICKLRGDFLQAEDFFKKAVALNPKNDGAYVGLGWLYGNHGKFSQAEDSYRKALELNPRNDFALLDFGRLYQRQRKYLEAENLFKKAIEINHKDGLNPEGERLLAAMVSLYEEMGKTELAKEYAQKVYESRSENCAVLIVNNYRKLREILARKGIQLVCVQYPMRNVKPLKKIFVMDESVIFVDNERVFKEALKKESYEDYFIDRFGGDFGHCTPKGNMLLAQNIANVILREVFKKR